MRIDQLPNTKWSRVTPVADERLVHYVLRDVRRKQRLVTLVAVLDGSILELSLDALSDRAQWTPGWRSCRASPNRDVP
jgi:tryptophan-rich hypothetical protein